MNITQALDRLKGGGAELKAIAHAVEAEIQRCDQQIKRLHGIIKEGVDQQNEYIDEIEKLRETLTWYGEQARLARLIHSEGDAGRHALAADGGKKARAVLNTGG